MGDFFKVDLRITPLIAPPITPPITPPPMGVVMEANITELEIKLLTLLKAEPRISAAAVASQLEIRIDTVKEYLHRLKGKGFLVREGNTRSGHWIVVEPVLKS